MIEWDAAGLPVLYLTTTPRDVRGCSASGTTDLFGRKALEAHAPQVVRQRTQ